MSKRLSDSREKLRKAEIIKQEAQKVGAEQEQRYEEKLRKQSRESSHTHIRIDFVLTLVQWPKWDPKHQRIWIMPKETWYVV